MPKITELGMLEAYEREKRLAPILNANERAGINVDLVGLERDTVKYETQFEKVSQHIFRILGGTFNLDSGIELAERLQASGKANLEAWPKTPTGRLSTARDALHSVIADPLLYSLLSYRGALKTCLTTFFRPWLIQARACGGRLHPSWNAVRGDSGGTRTGRLSSYNPNFQNIPTEFPETPPRGYPPLPLMRQYVLPNEGEVFLKADFHSQEVRVLGHFAEGAILQVYQDNPSADIHAVAAGLIQDTTGVAMERKQVKIIAFSILYGAGVTKIAEGLGVSVHKAAMMKKAYLDTLTGVREIMKEIEARAGRKETVRSWGGRVLRAPDPVVMAGGRIWNKDYVLINYLIQGSSADQTKEALIRHGNFYITVHDEICDSVKPKHLKSEIKRLRHSMESMAGWDVPMRAEISVGPNWANLEKQ
jgi:DNA polymerase-1